MMLEIAIQSLLENVVVTVVLALCREYPTPRRAMLQFATRN